MCGIVGYIGKGSAEEVLLEGLRRLEYRGYDSAGMAVVGPEGLDVRRSVGKLQSLADVLKKNPLTGSIGVGHTRWATHGRPSEANAHPHRDCSGELVVVQNGIIENHASLREALIGQGHHFASQTDTEVIPHLIEQEWRAALPRDEAGYLQAVRRALLALKGTYAVGILSAEFPHLLIGARQECPLIVGVGQEEYFLASDVPAVLNRTREVIFLDDGEWVILRASGVEVLTLKDNAPLSKPTSRVTWDALQAEKAGFRHFMLKEIFEQPRSVEDTLRGRTALADVSLYLEKLHLREEAVRSLKRVVVTACGTSWHAGLIGKYMVEQWARLPCEVDIASEWRYREPLLSPQDLLVAISQSGETADTLAALRHAKAQGVKTLAIVNVLGSTLSRDADGKIFTHCGPEIGVASTKAFTAQLTVIFLLSLYCGVVRGALSREAAEKILDDLVQLPRWIRETLALDGAVAELAKKFFKREHFLFLGRQANFPVALEGALKLKEISYIHAEGYPSGELKHGPIALVDPQMPVVAIATRCKVYEKVLSNVEEVMARGGEVILLATEGDQRAASLTPHVLWLPEMPETLAPAVNVIPLQLLAYHIAVLRGCDVDQPRNLAKSVTVE